LSYNLVTHVLATLAELLTRRLPCPYF
jgi:hypothetical protein